MFPNKEIKNFLLPNLELTEFWGFSVFKFRIYQNFGIFLLPDLEFTDSSARFIYHISHLQFFFSLILEVNAFIRIQLINKNSQLASKNFLFFLFYKRNL